jgi:Ca2+/Na+ antiporter
MTEEAIKTLDKRYEAVGWSLWLVWIGVTSIIPSLPDGTGMIGTGLLLLGLNVARYRRHIPISDFSLILGVLALLDGGVNLLHDLMAFHIELEFFPVLMVIIGTIMMVRAADRLRNFNNVESEKPKRGLDETDSAMNPVLAETEPAEIMQRA